MVSHSPVDHTLDSANLWIDHFERSIKPVERSPALPAFFYGDLVASRLFDIIKTAAKLTFKPNYMGEFSEHPHNAGAFEIPPEFVKLKKEREEKEKADMEKNKVRFIPKPNMNEANPDKEPEL